jgi:MFS family permease
MTDENESFLGGNIKPPITTTPITTTTNNTNRDERHALLDRALEEMGFGKFQIILLTVVSFGTFVDASETALISIVYPQLQSSWGASYEDLALIGSLTSVGMMFGAMFWGFMSDTFGRKAIYVITLILVSILGFASSFATNSVDFAVARLFVGFAYGGNTITGVTLMLEFMPFAFRARATSYNSLSWGFGALIITAVGWAAGVAIGWAWLVRIPSFLSLPILVGSCWVSESPRWMIRHEKHVEAVKAVEIIAMTNSRPTPLYFTLSNLDIALRNYNEFLLEKKRKQQVNAHLMSLSSQTNMSTSNNNNINSLTTDDTLSFIDPHHNKQQQQPASITGTTTNNNMNKNMAVLESSWIHSSVRILTSVSFLKLLAPLSLCWLFTSLAATLFSWVPLASVNLSNMPSDAVYSLGFTMACGNLVGCLLMFGLGSRLQRPTLLSWSLSICAILLFILGFSYSSPAAIYAMSFFVLMTFQCAINSLYLYTPEVTPTSARTTVFGICMFWHRLGYVVAPFILSALYSPHHDFALICYVFGSFFLGGWICTCLLLVTTLNEPLKEEQDFFVSGGDGSGGGGDDYDDDGGRYDNNNKSV